MKKIWIVSLMTLVLSVGIIGTAAAANSIKQGSAAMSVNVSDDFIIAGRYFVTKDISVNAGLGLGIKGGDADGVDLGIMAGARKYLKADDFAPFVGGFFSYSTTRDGDLKTMSLMGELGAEYFLHRQFSVEGSVGLGYMEEKQKTPTTSTKETTFGTQRFGLSLNFYFL